jgi:hypothetical protein
MVNIVVAVMVGEVAVLLDATAPTCIPCGSVTVQVVALTEVHERRVVAPAATCEGLAMSDTAGRAGVDVTVDVACTETWHIAGALRRLLETHDAEYCKTPEEFCGTRKYACPVAAPPVENPVEIVETL